MCALRAHINKSIFRKVLLGIEKVIKIFSIFDKLFPKLDFTNVFFQFSINFFQNWFTIVCPKSIH